MLHEHRRNLEILAAYLESLPDDYDQFYMSNYLEIGLADDLPVPYTVIHTCHTAACAVGHGPRAGIKPKLGEDWYDYEKRVFGVSFNDIGDRLRDWDYLFGPDNDDDHRAAAARIREYLAR